MSVPFVQASGRSPSERCFAEDDDVIGNVFSAWDVLNNAVNSFLEYFCSREHTTIQALVPVEAHVCAECSNVSGVRGVILADGTLREDPVY